MPPTPFSRQFNPPADHDFSNDEIMNIYEGKLNERRILTYKKISELYNIQESTVRDIFNAGADWALNQAEAASQFKATKFAKNWKIEQCDNAAVFVQFPSLPVAIAEMKRLSGLDEITIKF